MEYTEEEKKAIERCKELKKDSHKEWIGISNQVAIDIVLNLLERYYVYAHNYRDLCKRALDDVRKESKKNADSIPKEAVREFVREKIEEEDYVEDNIDTDIAPASHDKYINARELLELLGE